ncbi:hypothetical protein [uncultured Winogradskyella sp.]|uniref:hypothetical protein n=1 Tax=uncultured Winogradskyella sp. TaxID=395353 RepID=UPI00260641E8|nr:hypothetical protein [uncultured Winogradskyella sp.]
MKIPKSIVTSILIILFIQTSLSQEFKIPNNVKLESAEDYKKYETDILNCINWLENTPVNQNSDKRTLANAFLMQWATGTPTVTIEMQAFQLDLTKKNPELLMIFLGGWIKYVIQNPSEKDNIESGNIAGINSIIKVYSANKGDGLKKDKRIEKLIKMDTSELQKWVADKLK